MQTIVTHVVVRDGEQDSWDAALRERVHAAVDQPGFVGVQVATPNEKPNERVIIGTWETREHWQAWHDDEQFRETRRRLEVVDERTTDSAWHDVQVEEHR